jgi:hypothetical protein
LGDGSRFIVFSIDDTRESNVGKSVKKPGGPARACGTGPMVSNEFKKTGEVISDIGTLMGGAVPLEAGAMFAKTDVGSCISCADTPTEEIAEDERFGIKLEDNSGG